MADDLFTTWLGIPAGERPPDHYTLLGLPRHCADEALIDSAAQKRLEELDQRALHPDPVLRDQCQEMMNQIAAARMVLNSAKKRAAYDVKQFGYTPEPPKPEPVSALFSGTAFGPAEKPSAEKSESEKSDVDPEAFARANAERARVQKRRHMIAAAVFLAALIGAAILIRHAVLRQPSTPRFVDTDERPASRPATTQASASTMPAGPTPPAAVVPPPTTVAATQIAPRPIAVAPPPATQVATGPKSIFDLDPSHPPATNPVVVVTPPPVNPPPVVPPPVEPPPVVVPPAPPPPPAIVRMSAPPDAEVVAARQQLAALADANPQRLMKEALALEGKGVEPKRFALLQMSREHAIVAGLLAAALGAIDELNKRYVVDELALKADALESITRGTASPVTLQTAAKTALDLSYAAGDAKRYDLAERLATVALRSSRNAHDIAATRRDTLRILEVQKLKSSTP